MAAVRQTAERFRHILDNEQDLTGIVFSVRFGPNGTPVSVVARPEIKWRPGRQGARST